jgi:class 3 adenylate cyclase/tetratricopeptide (TPR) repeat protein
MDPDRTVADSADPGEQIDALLEQATQAIDSGDTARAVELAESAFALDPDNEDARAIVAFARFRSRRRSSDAPGDAAPPAPAPPSVPSGAAAAPAQPVESVGERRRLTVLFCDVVGSTELASRLDPEDTREVLRQYQAACASVIESYGGTVAHFIGDGILAYFGFPVAHEDDAVRAALAGREMVTAVETLRLGVGADAASGWLSIRVGIHTGLTVVADMGGGRKVETYDIVGETPNLAARIQGEAPPGEVLISEATFDLARAFIEAEDHGSPPLKGVARPVQLYRVIGERRTPWRFEAVRDSAGLLVGRQHELSVIDAAWARARDEGAVVFLRGDAGIGKSRLVDHAADTARQDGATVLIMQCASLRTNESLWPAAEAISALGAAGELEGLAPVDAILDDLSPAGDDHSGASPAKQREQRFAALIDWLDSLGEARRLLVVVEDLHWSDATTLELVHRLADRAPLGRFLLLLTSRTPLHFQADHVDALHVQPLSMDDCAMMIEQLVDDPDERIAVRNSVIARSDGVPLFINELTKLVIGSGSESLELSDENSVPIALHDLLVARVDQFADQREVAQALATFGQPTGAALLTSVLDQPDSTVIADLDALEAGGLIRQVGDRYEFVHVLLREAALRLQLRRHRRTLHGRIAAALEEAPAASRSFDDAIIAHHYSAAGDDMRAAEFWLRAGKSALRRNAQVEATELLNAALAAVQNLPDSPERAVAELDVVMALGPALINSKGYGAPDVEAVCLRAQELCDVVGDVPQRVPALINLWAFLGARAQHHEAVALADTIMELAQEAQSDDLLIEASVCVGVSNTFLANFDVALESFERIGAIYDATAHESHRFEYGTDPAALALSYRALIHWFVGNVERSRERSEETEAFARSLGHPFTEVFALGQTMFLRIFDGDLEDAERLLQECRELSAREAIPAVLPEIYAVLLMAERGDPTVPETCQAITDFARFAGLLVLMPYIEAVHADALSARGDHAEAEAMMAASLESMEATDERWAEAEIHRLRGNLLERRGAPATEVEDCYRLAITIARRTGAGGFEARANDSLERWLARS